MRALLPGIRPEERRPAWAAFATMVVLMSAHALLETARDALFLGSISASKLPWVYLLVAGTSYGVLELQQRLGGRVGRSLPGTLATAATGTLALWALLPTLGDPGLYALYVLTSATITLVLVQFWLEMGRTFTARQAKRVYAFVGTGSVGGAIAGFAAAGMLARALPAHHLVLAAAGALFAAAILTLGVYGDSTVESAEEVRALPLREALGRPYVRRLGALLLIATVALTLGDYLFKAAIADAVAGEDLATTFATLYLALNVLSLAVQVLVVSRVVRLLGVVPALAALPLLMTLGTAGLALGLGAAGAIALKGADGALRHTLHRTAVELLWVPMPRRVQHSVKGLIDVFAQRGGQAVASVGILLALAAGATTPVLAVGLLALLCTWVVGVALLRQPYFDVFRTALDEVAVATDLDFPDLDMASLESVIAALNSPHDGEVLAALNILAREGKLHLVPVLLLYHPADAVVVRALDLFTRAGRTDFLPVADRIQGNATPAVHAAVVRATMALRPDPDALRTLQTSFCRATRTTATVYLHALQELDADVAERSLDTLLDHENGAVAALAIAGAAPWTGTPLVERYLVAFLKHPDVDIRRQTIASIGELKAPALLRPVIGSLIDRELRHPTRTALLAYGPAGLSALEDALLDDDTPEDLRWELPRAIAEFGGSEALACLQRSLTHSGGMVQYRAIRALERLLDEDHRAGDRDLRPDASTLREAAEATLRILYRLMAYRLVLQAGAEADPARATRLHGYLVRLLRDKETHGIERVVRLVGLGNPGEDFARIVRGLASSDPALRSSSVELLEHFTPARIRQQVLGFVDGGRDPDRQRTAGRLATETPATYEAVLERLGQSRSDALRALALAQMSALAPQGA